jgi:hypothetical protein
LELDICKAYLRDRKAVWADNSVLVTAAVATGSGNQGMENFLIRTNKKVRDSAKAEPFYSFYHLHRANQARSGIILGVQQIFRRIAVPQSTFGHLAWP